MKQALSLSELNSLVAETINITLPDEFIVCAELAGVREVRGHCFMELVEKDPELNTPIARASAKCWKSVWQRLSPMFTRVTGQTLQPGMKVMLTVRADFHIAYGFSWIVTDISAEYSLGEIARRRREIIERLKQEGIFDMQHELALPKFCQRIAVISSEGAAGYGDFIAQLSSNPQHLAFNTTLFAAVMQGEQVESSVISALDQINRQVDSFDCVVIIRGGGATSDLSGFDTLALAEAVANFPLPIITGIGHERDESVIDLVACVRTKTPTAVAAYLIDHLQQTAQFIDETAQTMHRLVTARLETERLRLSRLTDKLPSAAEKMILTKQQELRHRAQQLPIAAEKMMLTKHQQIERLAERIPQTAQMLIQKHRHQIEMLSTRLQALDPKNILNRGYAMVMIGNKVATSTSTLRQGDHISIHLRDGQAAAIVETTSTDKHRKTKTT